MLKFYTYCINRNDSDNMIQENPTKYNVFAILNLLWKIKHWKNFLNFYLSLLLLTSFVVELFKTRFLADVFYHRGKNKICLPAKCLLHRTRNFVFCKWVNFAIIYIRVYLYTSIPQIQRNDNIAHQLDRFTQSIKCI